MFMRSNSKSISIFNGLVTHGPDICNKYEAQIMAYLRMTIRKENNGHILSTSTKRSRFLNSLQIVRWFFSSVFHSLRICSNWAIQASCEQLCVHIRNFIELIDHYFGLPQETNLYSVYFWAREKCNRQRRSKKKKQQ